jgi:hypothetical protein
MHTLLTTLFTDPTLAVASFRSHLSRPPAPLHEESDDTASFSKEAGLRYHHDFLFCILHLTTLRQSLLLYKSYINHHALRLLLQCMLYLQWSYDNLSRLLSNPRVAKGVSTSIHDACKHIPCTAKRGNTSISRGAGIIKTKA